LLSSVLPSWNKPLWSVSTGLVSGNQVSLALELTPSAEPATPSLKPGRCLQGRHPRERPSKPPKPVIRGALQPGLVDAWFYRVERAAFCWPWAIRASGNFNLAKCPERRAGWQVATGRVC